MSTLREAAQQALEALEMMRQKYGEYACSACDHADAAITGLRIALAQPIPHGCHVDLDPGMKPDGCVLDENRPEKCVYARRLVREGKDKTACEYWQPIEVKK